MTHETALRTIAEFMGWDTDIVQDSVVVFFIGKNCYDTESFDTMRMVFDEWREEIKEIGFEHMGEITGHNSVITWELSYGTPTDCALRLAECIEWWKSVK